MSALLEAFYSILSPIEYTRQKNRQSVVILAKGMSLEELVEQSGCPYDMQDGVAEVFLDEIVNRLNLDRVKNQNNCFLK